MKKIPFNLQEWLSDKSQKVVTKDGKSVRIVCTDSKADQPIVALITHTYEGGGTYETIETYNENGHYWSVGNKDADLDLFLVTEEPLTEFEKSLADIIGYAIAAAQVEPDKPTAEFAKGYAETLLSIARKQIVADGYIIVKPAFLNALANCDPSVVKEVMEDCTGTV